MSSPGRRVLAKAIGLGAQDGGTGRGEYLAVGALRAARYRVAHSESASHPVAGQRRAHGEFTIVDRPDVPVVVDRRNEAGALLTARPILLGPQGATVVLEEQGPPIGISTVESRARFRSGLAAVIEVQRWRAGQREEPSLVVEVITRDVPVFDTTYAAVELPPSTPAPTG